MCPPVSTTAMAWLCILWADWATQPAMTACAAFASSSWASAEAEASCTAIPVAKVRMHLLSGHELIGLERLTLQCALHRRPFEHSPSKTNPLRVAFDVEPDPLGPPQEGQRITVCRREGRRHQPFIDAQRLDFVELMSQHLTAARFERRPQFLVVGEPAAAPDLCEGDVHAGAEPAEQLVGARGRIRVAPRDRTGRTKPVRKEIEDRDILGDDRSVRLEGGEA